MPVRRAQRFICGRRTLVPDELVRTVLSLVKADDVYAYTREDMFATLVCTIEVHRGPIHYGAALNLRGPEAGTLWALWRDGGTPSAVIEIPDCPAGREVDSPCSEFEGHPGGHSWELDDPPRIATAFPLPRRSWM
ncbi:hypothetical protein OG896_18480 [Streptomyces sp. NBC_00669]|uniref:hypothetical protein n=1 Tax=unclassified Streptomyces TaxID=2593676 RepID=UPI002E1CC2B1|nr:MULTISPECIES: hypothetical protein [unclassified Streptomyces]